MSAALFAFAGGMMLLCAAWGAGLALFLFLLHAVMQTLHVSTPVRPPWCYPSSPTRKRPPELDAQPLEREEIVLTRNVRRRRSVQ